MREKPSIYASRTPSIIERSNDLYRSLEPTFEHLLQCEDPDRHNVRQDAYVRHATMERELMEYCSGQTNAVAFLVGATGIGKSTLIRHALQINRPPILCEGTLIIFFSFNQRYIADQTEMRNQMAKVFQQAVWLAKGGEEKYDSEDIDKLCAYVTETSPDILNDPRLDLSQPPLQRTKALIDMPEVAYQTSQIALKYYAASNLLVNRLVLIIDDLEMLVTPNLQKEAICNALETRGCLLNTASKRQVPVRLLISVRPETHEWVSQLSQVRTTVFREIRFDEPVSLFEIFKMRFDAVFNRDEYKHIRDPGRLEQAMGVLDAVGDALANKFSGRFVRLNNFDLRLSLEVFRQVVCNRRWLQRDPDWQDSFVVEGHNFAITAAAVLRALGMGEGEVYPQGGTCLANLLHNLREPSSDLILLYIIKYLQARHADSSSRAKLEEDFKRALGTAFDIHLMTDLIEYGLARGLIHQESSENGTRLTVTPRAKELYSMLEESTLLLELFRDDMWHQTGIRRPLRPTMMLGGASERFLEVANLIDDIWTSEVRLRGTFQNNRAPEMGSAFFGTVFEAARLRSGFARSVDAFYPTVSERPGLVAEALAKLKSLSIPKSLQGPP